MVTQAAAQRFDVLTICTCTAVHQLQLLCASQVTCCVLLLDCGAAKTRCMQLTATYTAVQRCDVLTMHMQCCAPAAAAVC
jgi:hypothetical protein